MRIQEAEREACAKVCEEGTEEPLSVTALKICLRERNRIANAIRARGDVHASDISQEGVDETAKSEHEFECPRCGHCCKEWVGQPDLARVGEVGVWGDKREWVGLTDEEIKAKCPRTDSIWSLGWYEGYKACDKNTAQAYLKGFDEGERRYRWLRKEYAGGRETYLAECIPSENALDEYIDRQMAKTSIKTERWSGK